MLCLTPHPSTARATGTASTTKARQMHQAAERWLRRCVRKRVLLRHLYIKMIVLPRQARDKHRESTQKRTRFCRNHSVIPNVLLNDCCGLCAAAGPTCAASQWVPAAHPEGTPVPKNKNGTCILKATRDKPINIKSGAAFFPPGVLPPAPVIRSQVWLSLSSTVSRNVCCTCPEPWQIFVVRVKTDQSKRGSGFPMRMHAGWPNRRRLEDNHGGLREHGGIYRAALSE